VRTLSKPLVDVLEKEWDQTLFAARRGLAPSLGWSSYHTLRSRGSASGYPDRTLWRDRGLFAELKRELTGNKREDLNRRPKPAQVAVLDGLARAGWEVYVWRPSDIDEVAEILGRRWRFYRFGAGSVSIERAPFLAKPSADGTPAPGTIWIPRSLWIPGAGRAGDAGAATELPDWVAAA
jgi:hypothetical protein